MISILSVTTTSSTLSISLDSTSLPASRYEVTFTMKSCSDPASTKTEISYTDLITISGLEEGMKYLFNVTATNELTASTSMATGLLTTLPIGKKFIFILMRNRQNLL